MKIYPPDGPPEVVEPKKSFRGTFAHPDLFHLHEKGKITATEFVLVLHIDALVNAWGLGCWASNHRLGEIMGTHPKSISRMLKNLIELGILIAYDNPKFKRILETSWSRIKVGKRKLNKRSRGNRNVKGPVTLRLPCSIAEDSVFSGENKANSLKKRTEIESDSITVDIKQNTQSFVVNSAALAASPTDVPTIPKNPEHKVSTMREGFGIIPQYSEAVASTFDTTIVGRLITLLQNKKVSIQNKRARSVWPKEIAKLRREVSEERISSVFSWYERNAGLKYTPEVLCAKTFRIKFAKLESAMKRSSGGSEPVAISPEDEKIANDIGAWNWPAGLKKELPPFVATVRKQYQTIKAKLTAHITGLEQYSDGRPKDHFAQTVYSLLRSMPSSGGFVKLWIKEVHQKILFAIGKHGEWKGSLLRTHGTLLGSERFETWIASLIKSETKWQKIKSEVLS